MGDLAKRKCEACEGGVLPLGAGELPALQAEVHSDWELQDGTVIRRTFKFGDFVGAWGFATKVALLAESEGHHPDFEVGWGRVSLLLTTHSAGGLTENDFIMAAKVDELAGS